jgi:CheY-like chemotaxis protein
VKKNIRTVLCVDDDADDREIVCAVINEIDPSYKVVHAENGHEAHQYLNAAKKHGDFPCLIILDINMPVMDGKETLVELKKDEVLKQIPVAMFSTSSSPADVAFFSTHGVELVKKPNDLSAIAVEVTKLLSYCGQG